MKFLTTAIVVALSLSACNSDSKSDSDIKKEIVADTTSNYDNSVLTDTGTAATTEAARMMPAANEAKHTKVVTKNEPKVKATPVPVTIPAAPQTKIDTVATQPVVANEPAPAAAEEKKGWSNAAKGAVIGGGAGAIGGAIISKKKGKGAVIGGVLGAAGGYIIGKSKDKKDTAR